MTSALRKYAIGHFVGECNPQSFGISFSIGNFQCYTWTCDFGTLKDKFNWTLISETTSKQPQNLDHLTSNPPSPSKNSPKKASLHCRTSAGRSSLKQPCSTQPCMVTESNGPLISSKLWPHRSTNNGQVGPWKCKPFFGGRCLGWVGSVGRIYLSGRQWWHRFILGVDDLFCGGGGCFGDDGSKVGVDRLWNMKVQIMYNSSNWTWLNSITVCHIIIQPGLY